MNDTLKSGDTQTTFLVLRLSGYYVSSPACCHSSLLWVGHSMSIQCKSGVAPTLHRHYSRLSILLVWSSESCGGFPSHTVFSHYCILCSTCLSIPTSPHKTVPKSNWMSVCLFRFVEMCVCKREQQRILLVFGKCNMSQ